MPLATRFWPYRPHRPPDAVGVYELGWQNGLIVYIGYGVVRDRVQSHNRDDKKRFSVYRCIITNDRRKARRIEMREQKIFRTRYGRLPTYNERIG
jgi:hypothetical protein